MNPVDYYAIVNPRALSWQQRIKIIPTDHIYGHREAVENIRRWTAEDARPVKLTVYRDGTYKKSYLPEE